MAAIEEELGFILRVCSLMPGDGAVKVLVQKKVEDIRWMLA